MPLLHWNLTDSYRILPEIFYDDTKPANFPDPQWVLFNYPLAKQLGLISDNENIEQAENLQVLCGNQFPANAKPLAQAYAGHQFGHFNMLGDGRASLLGEQQTPTGELIDIQLKGSGRTLYSRRGDGKAALGPMLREYVMSEAMHALDIPTTRSLAVVTTGETIQRERSLTGAVLTRVASSHIRVATFQFASAFGSVDDVKALADYTINRHFPEILSEKVDNPYLALLQKIIQRQAELIAKWQLVGFIHGVMNTDNMAISGETIDYGPCAFMDRYNPKTVFSSIDYDGLYRYQNQPIIARWNLARLSETLLPLLADDPEQAERLADNAVQQFMPQFEQYYWQGMAHKLGLFELNDQVKALANDWLDLMQTYQADYTNSFLRLTLQLATEQVVEVRGKFGKVLAGTQDLFDSPDFQQWQQDWHQLIEKQSQLPQQAIALMQSVNPVLIPRNALVEDALTAAEQKNLQKITALLQALQQPFNYEQDVTLWQDYDLPAGYRTFCGT